MTMTAANLKFFAHAKEVSKLSDFQKARIGSVAVYGNKILSVGFNQHKTNPTQQYYNRYRDFQNNKNVEAKIHSEIHCLIQIKDLDIDFKKVDLYIYRGCKDREFGASRPCKGCMRMIKDLGIKNLYYTSDDGYVYENII